MNAPIDTYNERTKICGNCRYSLLDCDNMGTEFYKCMHPKNKEEDIVIESYGVCEQHRYPIR